MKIRFYFRMMRIGFASPDGMDDFISALLSHFLAQRLLIDSSSLVLVLRSKVVGKVMLIITCNTFMVSY